MQFVWLCAAAKIFFYCLIFLYDFLSKRFTFVPRRGFLLSVQCTTPMVQSRRQWCKKTCNSLHSTSTFTLDICRGSLPSFLRSFSITKTLEKKTTKTRRKFTSNKRNYAARLPIRCSVVFILKQCGRPYDVVHPISAKKLLRKRKKVMRFTSW